MQLTPDVHAQIVRDRHGSFLREAADGRLVTRTRPCSTPVRAFWRTAARLGAVTLAPDGCGRRRALPASGR